MYIIINKEGQIYSGTYGEKHYWNNPNDMYFNAIIFSNLDYAKDVLIALNVDASIVEYIPVVK